jgi:hypothetical protein
VVAAVVELVQQEVIVPELGWNLQAPAVTEQLSTV